MPQEPKRRHSIARKGKRRASIHFENEAHLLCQNCGAPVRAHTVCKFCGFYKGKQIIVKKQKNKE